MSKQLFSIKIVYFSNVVGTVYISCTCNIGLHTALQVILQWVQQVTSKIKSKTRHRLCNGFYMLLLEGVNNGFGSICCCCFFYFFFFKNWKQLLPCETKKFQIFDMIDSKCLTFCYLPKYKHHNCITSWLRLL